VLDSSTIIEEIDAMRKSGLSSLAIFYYDFREDQEKDPRDFSRLCTFNYVSNPISTMMFSPISTWNTAMVLDNPAMTHLSVA
jgi:hypothetical protein